MLAGRYNNYLLHTRLMQSVVVGILLRIPWPAHLPSPSCFASAKSKVSTHTVSAGAATRHTNLKVLARKSCCSRHLRTVRNRVLTTRLVFFCVLPQVHVLPKEWQCRAQHTMTKSCFFVHTRFGSGGLHELAQHACSTSKTQSTRLHSDFRLPRLRTSADPKVRSGS